MQRPRFGTAQRASSKQWHITQYGVGHRSRPRHYLTRLKRHDKPFGTCPPLHLLCEKGKETEKTAPLLFAVRSGPASLSSAPRVHASLNFPPIFPIAVATAHDIACVPCCRRPAVPSSQLPAPGPAEEPRLRTRLPTSPNKPSLLTDRGGSQVPPWSFSQRQSSWLPSDQTAPRRRRRRAATGRHDPITAEDPPPPPTSDWTTASGRRSSSTWAFSPECRRSRLFQVRVLRDPETCVPSGCRQLVGGSASPVAPKAGPVQCPRPVRWPRARPSLRCAALPFRRPSLRIALTGGPALCLLSQVPPIPTCLCHAAHHPCQAAAGPVPDST